MGSVKHTELVKTLLPSGPAWPRDDDANLIRVLAPFGEELDRVQSLADQLITEANPITTVNLLTAREAEASLPDSCSIVSPQTFDERRAALLSKWATRGGQSKKFFIRLARIFGISIRINEFFPFRAMQGRADVTPLTNGLAYTWEVVSSVEAITSILRADVSAVGSPIREWGNALLECLINKWKPARTEVLFSYLVGEVVTDEEDWGFIGELITESFDSGLITELTVQRVDYGVI